LSEEAKKEHHLIPMLEVFGLTKKIRRDPDRSRTASAEKESPGFQYAASGIQVMIISAVEARV
jgi:hypothetical protein